MEKILISPQSSLSTKLKLGSNLIKRKKASFGWSHFCGKYICLTLKKVFTFFIFQISIMVRLNDYSKQALLAFLSKVLACNFIKKETRCFPVKFAKSRRTPFYRTPPVAASLFRYLFLPKELSWLNKKSLFERNIWDLLKKLWWNFFEKIVGNPSFIRHSIIRWSPWFALIYLLPGYTATPHKFLMVTQAK